MHSCFRNKILNNCCCAKFKKRKKGGGGGGVTFKLGREGREKQETQSCAPFKKKLLFIIDDYH